MDDVPADADSDNRYEIVRAAARAFMVNGYAGTSIDMVADELGCTKGRIYYQYQGKADLFFDVQREAMRMNIAVIEPYVNAQGSAYERLRSMIEKQILLNMAEQPFQRVLVQGVEMHLEGSTTPAQREVLNMLIQRRDEYEQHFVTVVSQGVKSGEFRAVDPRLFVKVMLGSIIWLTVWYRPRPDETQPKRERLASEMTDYMLQGLKPEVAAEVRTR
ncbi:MAG: TetR family transcriptional regulator [Burkholderiales bacterium]|nr:TetR family transcriptional regulator [Burkholderiales bacterium]